MFNLDLKIHSLAGNFSSSFSNSVMIRLSSSLSALNMKDDSSWFFAKGGLLSASSFILNLFWFSLYLFKRKTEKNRNKSRNRSRNRSINYINRMREKEQKAHPQHRQQNITNTNFQNKLQK